MSSHSRLSILLARLRKWGFSWRQIFLLVVALLLILIGALAVPLEVREQVRLWLIGLGLGSLVLWGVAAVGGSGSPSFSKLTFIDLTPKPAKNIKVRCLPTPANPDDHPPDIHLVGPGETVVVEEDDPPFCDGVRGVTVELEVEGLVPETQTFELMIPPPDQYPENEYVEEVLMVMGPAPQVEGEEVERVEIMVILFHRVETLTDDLRETHMPFLLPRP